MRLLPNGVRWDDDVGVGHFPVSDTSAYDETYFEKYRGYEGEKVCLALNKFRNTFVNRRIGSDILVDIGIGSGTFVQDRNRIAPASTFGYDVNLTGVRWLVERNLWWDPWFRRMPAASFWDSLEHVEHPDQMIRRVNQFAFVSIPIFEDAEHVSRSKHFRPREHFWYFTRRGLVKLFVDDGFRLVDETDQETRIGREDIRTFAFERVS